MTAEEKKLQEELDKKKADLEDDKDLDDEKDDKVDGTDDTDPSADSSNTEDKDGQKIPYSRFKDKVDEVNRLTKELETFKTSQEETRTNELKEQEKYRELYEESLETINGIKAQNVASKIANELKDAGYKEEQIARLSKLVEGETDEEITESIADLKIAFPTKTYVDPSPDQRRRQKHEGVDGDDIGQSMFDRLKNSGKLKGFK